MSRKTFPSILKTRHRYLELLLKLRTKSMMDLQFEKRGLVGSQPRVHATPQNMINLVDGSNPWCPRLRTALILFGVCGPCEWLRFGVGLGEEAVDGGLEVDDGAEDAAFKRCPDSLSKKSSTACQCMTASRAIGEIAAAFFPRRALAAISASSKNCRLACASTAAMLPESARDRRARCTRYRRRPAGCR